MKTLAKNPSENLTKNSLPVAEQKVYEKWLKVPLEQLQTKAESELGIDFNKFLPSQDVYKISNTPKGLSIKASLNIMNSQGAQPFKSELMDVLTVCGVSSSRWGNFTVDVEGIPVDKLSEQMKVLQNNLLTRALSCFRYVVIAIELKRVKIREIVESEVEGLINRAMEITEFGINPAQGGANGNDLKFLLELKNSLSKVNETLQKSKSMPAS